jgi:hypothetical protein
MDSSPSRFNDGWGLFIGVTSGFKIPLCQPGVIYFPALLSRGYNDFIWDGELEVHLLNHLEDGASPDGRRLFLWRVMYNIPQSLRHDTSLCQLALV